MRSRVCLAVIVLTTLAVGCEANRRVVRPLPPPALTVRAEGLALAALAGRWRGFPPDLDRYYVPVEAFVANERKEGIDLRLADFALLDATGRERAPVPPAEATRTLFGVYGRRAALAPEAGPEGSGGATPAGAPVTPARTTFFFSGHFVFPLYPYYAYPYPYYVVPPPYRYRTYAELTGDLLRMGLHDGRLDPGASIHGFLYFPRADGERRGLRLRWSPPGAAAPLIAQVEDGAPAPRY